MIEAIGFSSHDHFKNFEALESDGIHVNAIALLAEELGISEASLLDYLGLPENTVNDCNSKLNFQAANAVYGLADTLDTATRVIGTKEIAVEWMKETASYLCELSILFIHNSSMTRKSDIDSLWSVGYISCAVHLVVKCL